MTQWDRTEVMDGLIADVRRADSVPATLAAETKLYNLANAGTDLALAAELVWRDFAYLDEQISKALPEETVHHIRQLYTQIVRFKDL